MHMPHLRFLLSSFSCAPGKSKITLKGVQISHDLAGSSTPWALLLESAAMTADLFDPRCFFGNELVRIVSN